jgi:bile acid:Na+ symporter, BASS family
MSAQLAIKLLTALALTGLLFATGLRLTFAQIGAVLQDRARLSRVILANFLLVPALTFGAARLLHLPAGLAAGMMILAAAPFAPVVPVFTKMCRADLALAAALTGLFPFLSAFLTPLVCEAGFRALHLQGASDFHCLNLLFVLVATITVPLLAGLGFNFLQPQRARRLLRPVDMLSEGVGAVSLAFVTVVESRDILATGWVALLIMVGLFEVSLGLGYILGGPTVGSRRVIALGTSNRNIALALLIAAGSFAGTPVLAAVVANGLLLILLGLLHTGWWRFRPA